MTAAVFDNYMIYDISCEGHILLLSQYRILESVQHTNTHTQKAWEEGGFTSWLQKLTQNTLFKSFNVEPLYSVIAA